MDWTSEAIDQLRALWAEGHSTAEIGRRMGISKNAVVGKAHRLSLPARPSPIRRDPEALRPAQPRRAAPPTPRPAMMPMRRLEPGLPVMGQPRAAATPDLPAEPATPAPAGEVPALPAAPVGAPVGAPPGASLRPAAPRTPAPAAAASPAVAVVRPFPRASHRSCCWPMGEPGTAEFRFCGGDALPSKPYCAEHAAIAYVKVRDRREDAA